MYFPPFSRPLSKHAPRPLFKAWTLRRSLAAAALPAVGYSLQNWLSQLGYKNLDSLTFNLLNQTKTLFAALCLYLVMGKKQSHHQLVALSLLLAAALLLNTCNDGNGDSSSSSSGGRTAYERLWFGVLPVLAAAFLSGLCGATTQRTLQTSGYNASQLSLELAVYGVLTLMVTLTGGLARAPPAAAASGDSSWRQAFFRGWTRWTWMPVLSQAAGGVIVGQVLKPLTSKVLYGRVALADVTLSVWVYLMFLIRCCCQSCAP